MRIGTRSLLFGVHQFLWHPITVYIAWLKLYGRPNWRETICIAIHDWGYWGKPNMDGIEGERHPELAAEIAFRLFGIEYEHLCLFHSRHYARKCRQEPSQLCWADKLSIIYEPYWWYLFRARLSGELKEYRKVAAAAGFIPLSASDREWFVWIKDKFEALGREQRNVVAYANPERGNR
jgi:hypothetical protein